VPGEKTSPTQPFPTKPPAYDYQGVEVQNLIDFTPELHAEAMKLAAKYKLGPMFTPPVVSKIDGPLATLVLPSATGGTNWQGGGFDPETHIAYMPSQTNISPLGLLPPDAKISDMNFVGLGDDRRPHDVGIGRRRGRRRAAARANDCTRTRSGGWWRRWRRLDGSRAAVGQAAVRPDHSDRSRLGNDQVANRAR
jgi:hypothetical protein